MRGPCYPTPPWLAEVPDDDAFLDRLLDEVQGFVRTAPSTLETSLQTLSIGSTLMAWLSNGASAVGRVVGNAAGAAAGAVVGTARTGTRTGFLWFSGYARPPASAVFARFFGDAFAYLENRLPIVNRVLVDIDAAVKAKRAGDRELYLIGHSFGGIILYDILTHFRPDLQCDLYVTVGSQVALFAEIARLAGSANLDAIFKSAPDAAAPRPAGAKRWINVFDATDLLGFGTRGVFAGAWDCRFDTDAFPILSHGAYFDTPRFFNRLRERVSEAFKLGTDRPRGLTITGESP